VLASTNRNLQEYVDEKKFRQDLYYRLNVVPIRLPSLRERLEDIPLLTDTFIQRYGAGRGKAGEDLVMSPEAVGLMQQYDWPGNIRELENVIERICVMEEGPVFGPDALPVEIRGGGVTSVSVPAGSDDAGTAGTAQVAAPAEETLNIAELERLAIIKALRKTGGNRKNTADLLGVSIRTLRNKLNQYRDEGTLPEDIE
jgi:DNA-binding NtrC family response regulator